MAVTVDLLAYHHVVHAKEILADDAPMQLVPEAIRHKWEDGLGTGTFREVQSRICRRADLDRLLATVEAIDQRVATPR